MGATKQAMMDAEAREERTREAAPEMLKALFVAEVSLVDLLGRKYHPDSNGAHALRAVRAAIFKATGETEE
jgi:predicted nucleotide-binding protein (sugar kinase/HSP70/actin superfamily)